MKRTVVNGRTIGGRVVSVAALGLIGVLGYSAIRFIGGAMDRRETRKQAETVEANLQERIAVVEHAIQANDFPQAEAAFQALDAADALPPEREAVIRVTLERAVQQHRREVALQSFNAALAAYDHTAAAQTLTTMEQSGSYVPGELVGFRGQVAALQDEGQVFQQLLTKIPAERRGVITYYLTTFPNGAHAAEVRTTLFIDHIDMLTAQLQRGTEFPTVLAECEELTALALQYHGKGVVLPSPYSVNSLDGALASYAPMDSITEQTPKDATLRVRLAPENVNLNWNAKYRAERDATIPIGSTGKNLGYLRGEGNDRQWLVRFDRIGGVGAWTERWTPSSDYWKDNANNVAAYRREELETMNPLSPAERFAADRAFEKLTAAMEPYFSREVSP